MAGEEVVAQVAQSAWHGFMRFLSVLVWTLVIAGLGWTVYVTVVKPHTNPTPTTRQMGQRDNIEYVVQPRSYFGCMNFRIQREKEAVEKAQLTNSTEVNKK